MPRKLTLRVEDVLPILPTTREEAIPLRAIRERLGALYGSEPDDSNLRRKLYRLEHRGLVSCQQGRPKQYRSGVETRWWRTP